MEWTSVRFTLTRSLSLVRLIFTTDIGRRAPYLCWCRSPYMNECTIGLRTWSARRPLSTNRSCAPPNLAACSVNWSPASKAMWSMPASYDHLHRCLDIRRGRWTFMAILFFMKKHLTTVLSALLRKRDFSVYIGLVPTFTRAVFWNRCATCNSTGVGTGTKT